MSKMGNSELTTETKQKILRSEGESKLCRRRQTSEHVDRTVFEEWSSGGGGGGQVREGGGGGDKLTAVMI